MSKIQHKRRVSSGGIIFAQGDVADCAYIIECGKVQVFINRDGQQVLFATLTEGELMGEMALIDGNVRTATALAVTDTTLISIPCNYVRDKMKHSDPTLRLFLHVVMERYRDIHTRLLHVIEEVAFLDKVGSVDSSSQPNTLATLKERCQGIQRKMLHAIHDMSHQAEGVISHEPESQHTAEMLKKEHALSSALDNRELVLYYQPIVDLSAGFIAGCEALIRWQSPEIGFVSPADFIPLAEKTGLIVPMGRWIIEDVLQAAQKVLPLLSPAQREVFHFGINLSARQFESEELVGFIEAKIKKYQIEPRFLTFEITESLLMEDPGAAEKQLNQLRDLGVNLAIDDFGTGYSSFSYLHRFPIGTLKIDRAFVSTMTSDTKSRSIVESLVHLAHNLDMDVVAEGIEHPQEYADLKAFTCDYAQGFYMSKPVPLATFIQICASTYSETTHSETEPVLPKVAGSP